MPEDAEMKATEQVEQEDVEMKASEKEGEAAPKAETAEEKKDASKDEAVAEKAAGGEAVDLEEDAGDEELEEAKPPEPEEPKELEEDAPADKRKKHEANVAINTTESTLNVVSANNSRSLMSLNDGGMQYMMAATRANVGIKAGRYAFEVRIGERRTAADRLQQKVGPHCKLGFTVAGSSLFLGEEDNVAFDSEGNYVAGANKTSVCSEWATCSQVFGVLLNLDSKSPNFNTVSLFKDGQRVCQPQTLPDSMKGKVLYPTFNYRSMTLLLNFGPVMWHPLPFTCNMVQGAAKADVEVVTPKKPAKDGKYEVLFPVGLPDEGTFEWLDGYLKEHPEYTELSSRANLQWGLKSGLWRKNGSWVPCNDEPGMEFGVRELDGDTFPQMIQAVTDLQKRNYIAMEVKKSLSAEERKQLLTKFDTNSYKKVAVVVVGEPPKEFKAKAHEQLLVEKRKKVAEEVKQKREAADRAKVTERAKAAKERERVRKEKEVENAEKGLEKDPEEDAKEEAEAKAAEEKEDANAKSLEDEIKEAEAALQLSEQEKSVWFKKSETPDLHSKDFSRLFSTFTLPSKEEGFDEIRYIWQKGPACEDYLKKYLLERKLTERVEDLQPGQWFKDQLSEFNKILDEWKRKHSDWTDPVRRKQAQSARKAAAEKDKKKEAPKEEEEKKEDADAEKKDAKMEDGEGEKEEKEKKAEGEEGDKGGDDEKKEEQKEGEKKDDEKKDDEKKDDEKKDDDMEADGEEKEDEEMGISAADMDVFGVDDVCDVGTGEPLFANFSWEDWMALTLRFELHLLAHAYRRDMDDSDRPSFHESHLQFYYNKYFRKQLDFKSFGVENASELLAIVKDTLELIPKNSVLDTQVSDDTPLENFVRLTEDHRRERERIYDLGDESVALKFQRPYRDQSQQYNRGGRYGSQQSYNRNDYNKSDYNRGDYNKGSQGSRYSNGNQGKGGQQAAGSNRDSRSGYGGQSGGYGGSSHNNGSSYGGNSGYGSRSAPPAPPPSRGGYSSGGHSRDQGRDHGRDAPRSGDKRSYPPPVGSYGGDRRGDPRDNKAPRTSYNSAPPARGGSSYGSSGGGYGRR